MSRKKTVLLASAVALLIVAAIFIVILLSSRNHSNDSIITLPDGSSGSITVGQLNPANLNSVDSYLSFTVTKENIVSLITSMRRPDNYTTSFLTSVSYGNIKSTIVSDINILGGFSRIDITQTKRVGYSYILTPNFIYGWEIGSVKWTQTSRTNFIPDELARLPGYNDITEISPSSISDCGFWLLGEKLSDEAIWTIYIEFYDSIGLFHCYFFSIDNGLIVYAETLYGDETVYKTAMKSISYAIPASELFILPDGTLIN